LRLKWTLSSFLDHFLDDTGLLPTNCNSYRLWRRKRARPFSYQTRSKSSFFFSACLQLQGVAGRGPSLLPQRAARRHLSVSHPNAACTNATDAPPRANVCFGNEPARANSLSLSPPRRRRAPRPGHAGDWSDRRRTGTPLPGAIDDLEVLTARGALPVRHSQADPNRARCRFFSPGERAAECSETPGVLVARRRPGFRWPVHAAILIQIRFPFFMIP
jgi:hypothetical protein